MSQDVFRVWFFIGLAAAMAVRLAAVRQSRTTGRDRDPMQPIERVLTTLYPVGLVVLPLGYVAVPWLGFADYGLPVWAAAAGAAVWAAGVWLLWRSHVDLGRNWSVAVHVTDEQTLVTEGVYRRIRHPMYAAHWLMCVGQVLLLQNWLAGWVVVVAFVPFYFLRVAHEELAMIARFGDAYRGYMARTGRVVPRWPN
jgi:protein-S-isoprenylcysteine O-methyltransferase Ste14